MQLPAFAINLVTNGTFENSTTNAGSPGSGGIGHIDKIVTLPGWLKTCLNQCGNGPITEANSHGYAFVVDDTAATRPGGGFGAIYNNTSFEQLYFWGPNNSTSTSPNGFTGSPSGGKFVAIDGDFGRAKLSQTVTGLDTSKTYTLSFEYAGAQQGLNATDFSGNTEQKWLVDGITASQITVGSWINPSRGFTPWSTYSTTFTPLSASIDLTFTPWGNVVGGGAPSGIDSLPPFLLLDNVQILETTTPPGPDPGTPVPGPVPLLGVGAAFTMTRRLRRRVKLSS